MNVTATLYYCICIVSFGHQNEHGRFIKFECFVRSCGTYLQFYEPERSWIQ